MVNTLGPREGPGTPRTPAPPSLPTRARVQPYTIDELAAVIMPWAREHEPEKAAQVESKVSDPTTHRRWLGRLVELRWEYDHAWRGQVPLRALHETALELHFKHIPTELTIAVRGRYHKQRPRWTFLELEELTDTALVVGNAEAMALLVQAKHFLDLEHVPHA